MGVDGPDEGVVTESSALPENIRDGEGSGLLLNGGIDPRLVRVIWLALGADTSASAVSTEVIGAAEGVCERSSVGWVASLR